MATAKVPFPVGKAMFTIIAVFTSVGPYLADWSITHVKNPKWPPHARFHNGQTMTTGLLIGLLILYYVHLASPQTTAQKKTYANFILVLVHLYYVPALSGILYPGADWTDPESGARPPQAELFSGLLVTGWVAWWAERRVLKEKAG